MRRALRAGTAYFLILFALGFVLGTIRVLLIAPRVGDFAATVMELPIMLAAAFFVCHWAIRRWHVSRVPLHRWAIVFWFLILLLLFETLLGWILFGRTGEAQWAVIMTNAGMLGLAAQIIAASLPLFVEPHTASRVEL